MGIRALLKGRVRYVVAIASAATLAGGAYAFAASLSASTSAMGAGTQTVASPTCSPKLSFTTAWTSTNKYFKVTAVKATHGSSVCTSDKITAELQSGAGTGIVALAQTTFSSTSTGGSVTWTVPTSVNAATVTKVSAAVTGTH
jgi:hypothetical protein